MPWNDVLNLNLAWNRILKDMNDDPYPDILHYKDIQRDWGNFSNEFINEISNIQKFNPNIFKALDIPKKNYTLRPVGLMHIKDRLLYQSICDFLAPKFEPENSVFSYKLDRPESPWMFLKGVDQWKLFEAEVEKLCNQFPFVLETDLASYFEHIDHYRLLRILDDVFPNIDHDTMRPIKQALKKMLGKWNNAKPISIPQVNLPSSFLGNLYLDEVDKLLERRGLIYLRYVDDIRIFTNSISEARSALAFLIQTLRRIGLFVSSGKTRILPTEKILLEFEKDKSNIDDIDNAFKTRKISKIEESLPILENMFFSTIKNPEEFQDKHFRFCIYRYRKLKALGIGGEIHQPIVETVLQKLHELPNATDIFALYLSLFPNNSDVSLKILDFLESRFNIYPWQEMHLLDVLIRTVDVNDKSIVNRIKKYVRNNAKESNHSVTKTRSLILLGKIGDWADRRDIREIFYTENDFEIKKAILIAIQELNVEERNYFYRNVQSDSEDLDRIVCYLRDLSGPQYHYFNPPDPEDLIFDNDYIQFEEDIDYDEIWY